MADMHISAEQSFVAVSEHDEGQLALDIFETENHIFCVAPIAGVDETSLDISLTKDLLTITGNRPRPQSLPKAQEYFLEECFWGKFSRNILLPAAINSADIVARMERDIIIVQIPKARKVEQKKISIQKKNEHHS